MAKRRDSAEAICAPGSFLKFPLSGNISFFFYAHFLLIKEKRNHTYMLVKKDQGLGKIFVENCIISWIKSKREREGKKKIVKKIMGLFWRFSGKESAYNAGDVFDSWVGTTLEKDVETHSRFLAWKIPWAEEPGRLQSVGSRRIGHWTQLSTGAQRNHNPNAIIVSRNNP